MTEELCKLEGCNRPRRDHDTGGLGTIKHVFSEHGELIRVKEPKRTADRGTSVVGIAGDPVLRMLLIEKGVITVDEIENVERTLKTLGVVMTGGPSSTYRGGGTRGGSE